MVDLTGTRHADFALFACASKNSRWFKHHLDEAKLAVDKPDTRRNRNTGLVPCEQGAWEL
jgi:hypothetical protein